MAINKKYSHKAFTGQTFVDEPSDDFSNSEIKGSCFAQEVAYSSDAAHNDSPNHRDTEQVIFPRGMSNVTFTNCNLDNVFVPGPPVRIQGGSHRKIRVMNDLADWILDDVTNKPVEPMGKELLLRDGLSVDPADIPRVKLLEAK